MGRVAKSESAVHVAGSRVRYGPTGRAKRIKTGGAQWSDEAEEQFLDVLASSANVVMAAKATGFTPATAYWHRRRRPDFAERWSEALAQGYARLEILLVEAACRTMERVNEGAPSPSGEGRGGACQLSTALQMTGPPPTPPASGRGAPRPPADGKGHENADRPFAAMTVEQAMQVLRAHRHEVRGDGRRGPGWTARRRSFEEIRGTIVRKIVAIEAARALPEPG